MDWQPIATAPASEFGENVILALPDGSVGGGRVYELKDKGRVYSLDSQWLEVVETPTHWMPFPAPPKNI